MALSGQKIKKALVITAGTTLDPIIESIRKNDANFVYLVYGRPLSPEQQPNPFDIAYKAKKEAEKLGKSVSTREIDNPEDIDLCISIFRKLTKELSEFDEVIVNFTGGTKPMSAAAFYVFLTEMIPSELVFEYVGGKVRNEHGRVTRMEVKKSYRTASEELFRKIISYIQNFQFFLAKELSKSLPEKSKYKFIKKAAEAFWLWDSFEYEKAIRILNEIGEVAKALIGEAAFNKIPENVVKLRNTGNIVVRALRKMRKYQIEKSIGDVKKCYTLSLDAIANAERRLKTHNYTEAVLRTYRAIEIATQVKLLEKGINPWKVNWSKIPNYQSLLASLGYKDEEHAPEQLTLWNGLYVLDFVESSRLMNKIHRDLQFISQLRNSSALEHGYSSVSKENAERAVEKSLKIVKTILELEDISEINNLRLFYPGE